MDAPKLRRVVISALLGLGFLVLGFVCLKIAATLRKEPLREETPPPALAVSVTTIRRESVTEKLRGFGLAQPINRTRISSQVSGALIEIPAPNRVGARVSRGDVLAVIDPATYEAEVSRQKALLGEARENLTRVEVEILENNKKLALVEKDLQIAQSELQRAENLLKQGATSESIRDQARSNLQAVQQRLSDVTREAGILPVTRTRFEALLEAQQNALVVAERNLAFTRPTAPIDGVIEERFVDQGDFVQPGAPLFTIVGMSRLEMPLEIPASQAMALREGAPAVVTTDTRPPATARGAVERISPSINPRNRTVGAYVVIDSGSDNPIVPGTFLQASIDGRTFDDVFSIPRSAIVDGAIFLAVDGVAKKFQPNFEIVLDETALTRDALPNPCTLILNGFEQLYEGAPVEVRQPGGTPEDSPTPALVDGTAP